MLALDKSQIYAADFETTSYEGQKRTDVWAAGFVKLGTEKCTIVNSIRKFFNALFAMRRNTILYFHNLKFDGEFILNYLMVELKFKQSLEPISEEDFEYHDYKQLANNEIISCISNLGQWYYITVKKNNVIYEFRDSLKILPFSLRVLGETFGTKHKKGTMEYTGFREPGGVITDEEKEYLSCDLLVLKEALEIAFDKHLNALTIGSGCLKDYKNYWVKEDYNAVFDTDSLLETMDNGLAVKDFVRYTYGGGWVYVVRGKEKKVFHDGVTVDANSLYPSQMHSASGNAYPYGKPYYFTGRPEVEDRFYYFLHIRCRFRIKKNRLPFISTKLSFRYRENRSMETSDIWDEKTKQYYTWIEKEDGTLERIKMDLWLTRTDFELFTEQYDLFDVEYVDGVYFATAKGLFDPYIDKWREVKENNTGAWRAIAKLYSNNLYGKMAANDNSSFKIPYVDGLRVKYRFQPEHEKKEGYIPIGSAITAYARNATIRAAQANYYGPDEPGFIYADTDSIHCDLPESAIRGITLHPKHYQCWKVEMHWKDGYFVRPKTYMERNADEFLIRCAGLPENCKNLLRRSILGIKPCKRERDNYTAEEIQFMRKERTYFDFQPGIRIPGKLMPKRYPGGIVLEKTDYVMRE